MFVLKDKKISTLIYHHGIGKEPRMRLFSGDSAISLLGANKEALSSLVPVTLLFHLRQFHSKQPALYR